MRHPLIDTEYKDRIQNIEKMTNIDTMLSWTRCQKKMEAIGELKTGEAGNPAFAKYEIWLEDLKKEAEKKEILKDTIQGAMVACLYPLVGWEVEYEEAL